jgi:hypothetical protein
MLFIADFGVRDLFNDEEEGVQKLLIDYLR